MTNNIFILKFNNFYLQLMLKIKFQIYQNKVDKIINSFHNHYIEFFKINFI